jgi:hypothetical protein
MWGSYAVFKKQKIAVFIPRTSVGDFEYKFESFKEKCNHIFSESNSEMLLNTSQQKIINLTLDDFAKILCNQSFFSELIEFEYLIQYLCVYSINFLSEDDFELFSESDFEKIAKESEFTIL